MNDSKERPLLDCEEDSQAEREKKAGLIIKVSLLVASCWWGFGVYTVVVTQSLAVLASLVDATIDLLAQGTLLICNYLAKDGATDEEIYPLGVSRLEPIGVILCSFLMALASAWVIIESTKTLFVYYPNGPDMVFTDVASVMLAVVVLVKIVVWRIAKREYDKTNNVSLEALALDNFNDILSNFSALCFASVTRLFPAAWWMDPLGGILISLYIIRSWGIQAMEAVNMLVGQNADPEFIDKVKELASTHSGSATLDTVKAYHFGPKFLVEIELIMEKSTPLEISHDVGIALQVKIENLDECERCFVHMDYQNREHDDHDKSVPLDKKVAGQRQLGRRVNYLVESSPKYRAERSV